MAGKRSWRKDICGCNEEQYLPNHSVPPHCSLLFRPLCSCSILLILASGMYSPPVAAIYNALKCLEAKNI
jgi:hypothetical protein